MDNTALTDFLEAIESAGISVDNVKQIMDAKNMTVTYKEEDAE
jgi:hypothetical protein